MKSTLKRTWAEIDLDALEYNYNRIRQHIGENVAFCGVVKADAYGHGDVQVARMLYEQGVRMFAVSNIDEAVGLREAGIKGEILILGYSSPFYAKTLYVYDLTQAIVSEEYAATLAESSFRIKCQFAIDTGMNRIGLDGDEAQYCIDVVRRFHSVLNVTGIFTHLCMADTADEESRAFTKGQISKFKAIADGMADLNLPYVHCCNSAGGLFYLQDSNEFKDIGNIVRLGIVLYGLKRVKSVKKI